MQKPSPAGALLHAPQFPSWIKRNACKVYDSKLHINIRKIDICRLMGQRYCLGQAIWWLLHGLTKASRPHQAPTHGMPGEQHVQAFD